MNIRLLNKRFILLVSFFLFVSFTISAQAQEANLPAETQKAITKGLAAVKQQEWNLAIKYFKEAQEKAPLEPAVLFNLALACDKSGGKELASIAWYKAYLVLMPEAENAREVRQRIAELEVKVEVDINKFIAKAKESIQLLPEKDAFVNYFSIIDAQVAIGDFSAAIVTAKSVRGHTTSKEPNYTLLAKALAKAGKVREAKQLAEELRELCEKEAAASAAALALSSEELREQGEKEDAAWAASMAGEVLVKIAEGQAEQGDAQGAKDTINSIKQDNQRNFARCLAAEALAEGGNVAQAKEMVALIDKKDYNWEYQAEPYALIALAEAKAGDLAGAKKSLELAKAMASHMKKENILFDNVYVDIAKAQVEIGDFNGAKETMNLLKDYKRWDVNYAIFNSYLKVRDITAAKAMFPLVNSGVAYIALVEAQANAGDIKGAQETAKAFENKTYYNEICRFIIQSLIAKAQGHLKEAEVYEIYALTSHDKFKNIEDMSNFLQTLQTKQPNLIVGTLGYIANSLKYFLKQLHDTEAKWQKLRPQNTK